MSIEDIILDRDGRGISKLRPHLPENFCDQAAGLVPTQPGTAVVVTGFYILSAGATETDGPPGAKVIGDALQSLGFEVVYVTDQYTAPLMAEIDDTGARVVDFPITDDDSSRRFADDLMAELTPSVLISIERCGFTSEGLFRNMRGNDITAFNAKADYLFADHPNSIGIGDGGNEIGMGNLAAEVTTVPTLVKIPCVTTTTKLVITSVSNWGGYGLVAALSRQRGKNLLPSVKAEQELIRRTVGAGAVDGMSGKSELKVDGFTMEENSQTLISLHQFLTDEGVAS